MLEKFKRGALPCLAFLRMAGHLLLWAVESLALLVLCVPLTVAGLVVVPLALLRHDDSQKAATYKTDGVSVWWLRRLPRLARWWDNPYDGFLGDEYFRWAGRDVPFGWRNTDFLAQCWWGAVRNPLHRFKSFVIDCDVRRCDFLLLAGQPFVRDRPDATGFQFARALRSDGVPFYRLYWVWQWPSLVMQLLSWLFGLPRRLLARDGSAFCSPWSLQVGDFAAIVEIGHEFRADHWQQDYTGREYKASKGFAFLIHPCKRI